MYRIDRRIAVSYRLFSAWFSSRKGDERGEGVISTALAVLIVAFLGVAAYALFKVLLDDSGAAARDQIKNYGGK